MNINIITPIACIPIGPPLAVITANIPQPLFKKY